MKNNLTIKNDTLSCSWEQISWAFTIAKNRTENQLIHKKLSENGKKYTFFD